MYYIYIYIYIIYIYISANPSAKIRDGIVLNKILVLIIQNQLTEPKETEHKERDVWLFPHIA